MLKLDANGPCCPVIGGRACRGSRDGVKRVPTPGHSNQKFQQPLELWETPCPTPRRSCRVSGSCWTTFPAARESQEPSTRLASPPKEQPGLACVFPGEPYFLLALVGP